MKILVSPLNLTNDLRVKTTMKRLFALSIPLFLLATATSTAFAQSTPDGDPKAPSGGAPVGGRKPLLLTGDRIQRVAGGALTGNAPPAPAATPASPTPTPTTPGIPATGAANGASGAGKPVIGANGKAQGDTTNLPQFEHAMEYEPRSPNAKVSFSLEEASLSELVKVIGQLTGKRFIFGGKLREIKATVYSPQQVTVAEAYQAFLAILDANGLTVVPHGRFLKIVETGGIQGQVTPTYGPGQAVPAEARYVTRLHRLKNVSAEEAVGVLDKFKSKDAQVTAYAAGNMLIMTDSGTNIRRMMQIVDQIDVGSAGDQIWIEPIHYASASDIASRVNDLFDVKAGGGKDGGKGAGAGDLHVAKILPDERSNSLVIVATERAYLRMLELIKRLDVPQTGEGEIHVLPLQHADAVELVKTLNDIVGTGGGAGGGAKPGGAPAVNTSVFEGTIRLSADKSTNSIVVTSSLRDYGSLRAVVDRLDQARRQVFIDAVIMDLAVSRTDSFGMRFHGGSAFGLQSANDTLLFGGLDMGKTISLDPSVLQGAALGIRGPGIEGSQNLIPGLGLSIPAFGATLTALTTTSDTDVLSTPHILATDNIPAEISIGENVPIQQNVGLGSLSSLAGAAGSGAAGALSSLSALGGLGGGGTAARADVGTKIKIIPHLNESNEARLEITEEISEARKPEGVSQVVPITRRTANTTLTVKDQQTVVIGGLMRNRVAHGTTKIPLLGDIPLLGALFRQTTTEMQKTNLVLILTPYIIRDQSDLRRVFERKMQERQEFLDRYFVFNESQKYVPPTDYSRTNGLLEEIRQAYASVDEKKRLEEITKPKELRGHPPQTPLEMPAGASRAKGGAGGESGKPANLNLAAPPKSVERVEK
jgi:general secretion pathway protein D